GALDHQDVPFERLVRELKPDRNDRRYPLVQVFFDLDGAVTRTDSTWQMGSVTVTSSEPVMRMTPFELSLSLAHAQDGTGTLRGDLEYAADLFDRATAERMVQHLLELLRTVALRPSIALNELNLSLVGEGDPADTKRSDPDVDAAIEPPLTVH